MSGRPLDVLEDSLGDDVVVVLSTHIVEDVRQLCTRVAIMAEGEVRAELRGVARVPVAEVFDGLCLLVAGAFLVTPGFVTDTMGFLLLVPRLRAVLRRWAGQYLIASGRVVVQGQGPGPGPGPRPPGGGDGVVIDADYEEIDETDSRWGKGGEPSDRRGSDRSVGDRPDGDDGPHRRPPGGSDR